MYICRNCGKEISEADKCIVVQAGTADVFCSSACEKGEYDIRTGALGGAKQRGCGTTTAAALKVLSEAIGNKGKPFTVSRVCAERVMYIVRRLDLRDIDVRQFTGDKYQITSNFDTAYTED